MKTRNLVAWMITLAIWAAIVVPCFAGTGEMQKAQDAVVSFVNTVTASGATPADCYKAGQNLEAIRNTLTRDEQSLVDAWSKERFGSALKPLPQWKRDAVLLGMDSKPDVQTVADTQTAPTTVAPQPKRTSAPVFRPGTSRKETEKKVRDALFAGQKGHEEGSPVREFYFGK